MSRPLHAQVDQAVMADGRVAETTSEDYGQARTLGVDHDWFKRAVFYEVLVRAFADSNRDGTGDIRGLTEKLDYIQWLGVDCIWLPPFYDSPLRDGGYDIRDFRAVLPEFGTVDDFVVLLDEAHKRGIRVITDLVMNHTSDQHAWFEESRRNPDGPYGDFYVWSDDDTRYPEARIIFVDTETSNWTYDRVRGQFFWHRFFSHQPDLNYDCEAVQDAMIDVLRFWLDIGIDGFRLDAVPFLFERDGTNCENLPETHAFLRRCRKVMQDEYPGRVLLAEANQWPADVVEYYGDPEVGGDECQMAFHFPLMPRIFMAVLLSLPGSPVLYYGDEIGMGDNIWAGDRDGVRSPMQWTPDRNAGFSTSDPGRLYLPIIMDAIYGYQVTNVESQTRNTSSLLHWTRRMIQVRKSNPAFGLGSFIDLGGSNPSVLSYVREFGDDTVLCVNNLSRFAQPVELDLRPWRGREPLELLGGVRF